MPPRFERRKEPYVSKHDLQTDPVYRALQDGVKQNVSVDMPYRPAVNKRALGQRLRELRGDRSQEEVAREIVRRHPEHASKIHQVWVSRREKGVGLTPDDAQLIAEALGHQVVVSILPVDAALTSATRELDDAARDVLLGLARVFPLLTETERDFLDTLVEAKRRRRSAAHKGRA
jgi:hypothetical protein